MKPTRIFWSVMAGMVSETVVAYSPAGSARFG
jgi:hypothetical protein